MIQNSGSFNVQSDIKESLNSKFDIQKDIKKSVGTGGTNVDQGNYFSKPTDTKTDTRKDNKWFDHNFPSKGQTLTDKDIRDLGEFKRDCIEQEKKQTEFFYNYIKNNGPNDPLAQLMTDGFMNSIVKPEIFTYLKDKGYELPKLDHLNA